MSNMDKRIMNVKVHTLKNKIRSFFQNDTINIVFIQVLKTKKVLAKL